MGRLHCRRICSRYWMRIRDERGEWVVRPWVWVVCCLNPAPRRGRLQVRYLRLIVGMAAKDLTQRPRRAGRRDHGELGTLGCCNANLEGARTLEVVTPWKTLVPVEVGREYVALLSYLPLRSYLKIPLFARFSYAVHRQMLASPGAVGYSMRAKLLNRQFWTLSVWESDRGLMEFVAKVPHGEIMKAL